jgi:hypothetical protein
MGSAAGSPLMPAQAPAMGQISPLSANPFSLGSTRVTPPPTGSVGSGASLGTPGTLQPTTNPYLGSQIQFPTSNAVAMGTTSPGYTNEPIQRASFSASPSLLNQSPIGSGVQSSNYIETASNGNTDSMSAPYRDPDRSGMRVIDLVNTLPSPNQTFASPNQTFPSPYQQANLNSSAPAPYQPPRVLSSAFQPLSNQTTPMQNPRTNSLPNSAPMSTLPSRRQMPSGPTGTATNEPLEWRRPGTTP